MTEASKQFEPTTETSQEGKKGGVGVLRRMGRGAVLLVAGLASAHAIDANMAARGEAGLVPEAVAAGKIDNSGSIKAADMTLEALAKRKAELIEKRRSLILNDYKVAKDQGWDEAKCIRYLKHRGWDDSEIKDALNK